MINKAGTILNHYSKLYRALTNSWNLVGADDYIFVLKSIRSEIQRAEAEIQAEIVRDLADEDQEQIRAAYEAAQSSETPVQLIMSGHNTLNLAVNTLGLSLDGKIQIRRTLRNAASKSGYTYDELKPHLKTITIFLRKWKPILFFYANRRHF